MKLRFDVKRFCSKIKTFSLKKTKRLKEMTAPVFHFIKNNSAKKKLDEKKGTFTPFFRLKDVSIGIKLNV
ncbi:MAG TPA: hypothetical protein PLH43_04290, partial [Acetivibrio sp.]|uniref:hypothetical protein n=1 Tax=Acetivibrio sp. TaxID=1872092 RepID=UPI002B7F80D2